MDESLTPVARWSLDGHRLFVALVEPTLTERRSVRVYFRQPDASWRAVTPEGVGVPFVVSPDSDRLAARASGAVTIYPADGSAPRRLDGERGVPIQWTQDGGGIYLVARESPFRARIYRRDLASGRVEAWREVTPPDPSGVTALGDILITPDGKTVAYAYSRVANQLYLVSGLR